MKFKLFLTASLLLSGKAYAEMDSKASVGLSIGFESYTTVYANYHVTPRTAVGPRIVGAGHRSSHGVGAGVTSFFYGDLNEGGLYANALGAYFPSFVVSHRMKRENSFFGGVTFGYQLNFLSYSHFRLGLGNAFYPYSGSNGTTAPYGFAGGVLELSIGSQF